MSADGRLAQSPFEPGSAGAHPISSSGAAATFEQIESAAYRSSLERANGNVAGAARLLNISRAQLEYRLRRLGITPSVGSFTPAESG
jgi:transcriptional regulator with GAF, ATPase, and Fis domain